MGQETVATQSSKNFLNLVLGFGIGAFSNLIILPHLFKENPSLLGAIQVTVACIYLISDFVTLGSPLYIVRYFSKELLEIKSLGRMLAVVASLFSFGYIGYLIFVSIYPELLGKMLGYNESKYDFGLAIMIGVFFVAINKILGGFLNASGNTNKVSFANELLMRLLMFVWCFVFVFIQDFKYEITLIFVFIGMNVYLFSSLLKDFNFRRLQVLNLSFEIALDHIKYSLVNGVSILVNTIQQRSEMIVLAMLLGTDDVAIFNVGAFLATVIMIPTRAISPMATTVVARSWPEGDLGRIHRVYKASATNQLILSGIVFIALLGALPVIDMVLPETFLDYKTVFLLLAIAKLTHGAFGINGSIINTSSRYRIGLYINILFVFLLIGGMFLLVPIYGKNGAAIASLVGIIIVNLVRAIYLNYQFGLKLINLKLVLAAIVIYTGVSVVSFLSFKFNSVLISISSSVCVTLIVIGFALRMKWSEDLNKMIFDLKDQILSRLK